MIAVWAIAVLVGMGWVYRYKATAGTRAAPAPATWPAGLVELPRTAGRGTIVMLAHPHCPCTEASVAELALVMARVGRAADAYVLFTTPSDEDESWAKSRTWSQAARIPGVRAIVDRDGAIAARFGGVVSGHTVAYDAAGTLLYSGGITPSRGHQGENAGRWQIVAAFSGRTDGERSPEGPTYGCELVSSGGTR